MFGWLVEGLRRFKWSYMFYNFFKRNQLAHNVPVYQRLGLKKTYFSPVSSEDFKKLPSSETPWLDVENSKEVLPQNLFFTSLPIEYQQSLALWSQNGYAILPEFFTSSEADGILTEIDQLVQTKKAYWRYNKNKIMFAVHQSPWLRSHASPVRLESILGMLLDKKVRLFQSINFYRGSQQKMHSDTIHMTTYPLGFMIAVWIALEDVTEENGPLAYIPGSHKLPYILNHDFGNEGTKWMVGDKTYDAYESHVEELIAEQTLEKKLFLAKKGDVLIWHANLLHGGMPITNPSTSRKSMVMHYYAEDVVAYHEYTQRPALVKQS